MKPERRKFMELYIKAENGDEEAIEQVRALFRDEPNQRKGARWVKVRIIYKNGRTKDYRSIAECAKSTGKSETGIKYCLDNRKTDKMGRRFEFIQEDE